MSQRITATKSQAGFTLVELAIVMIIIGLLIGGVLKGQELIGNAQVTATVAQLKGVDAGVSTFKDTYAGLPGDITGATNRLPNCTGICAPGAADGNQRLNSGPGQAPGAESIAFFPQLSAANLITGIVPGTATFGGNFPQAKITGNGLQAGSSTVGNAAEFPAMVDPSNYSTGLYLAVTNTANTAVSAATVGLKPTEASRIDTKLDDGVPGTGSVRAVGTAGVAGCGTVGAAGVYSTAVGSNQCALYVKIQS